MLLSMFVDPAILSSSVVHDRESRRDVERLLWAVVDNGVLVAGESLALVRQLVAAAETLDDKLGQTIKSLVGEIATNRRRYVASPTEPLAVRGDKDIVQVVTTMAADMLVVADEAQKQRLVEMLVGRGIEVMRVDEVPDSAIERLRCSWRAPQRLDTLDSAAAARLLGRPTCYARRITVIERQISACAPGSGNLLRHLEGIAHVARVWSVSSPYSAQGLDLEIITAGGEMGARGRVSARELRTAIQDGLARVNMPANVRIAITIKQDNNPPLTRDRFLEAKSRSWGVRHGLDGLGQLGAPPTKPRAPTFIDPDGPANRELIAAIRQLPDAAD